ncbi:terminase small subunit [Salmonella enterica]|uniref:terminase small subunit n=1 Tax=Salmonella enterica TaxID=28901 RepID=UPI0009AC44C9|nr:terminase small subunit [Salmonella enterica]ECI6683336.1 terminase small subunit [Salmonella enterica subsp. enterica]EAM3588059.1 terminase small subunit [Salmonella enterica]EAN1765015.1 terminase small subunit [Salmonella enterica]EAN2308298.1 terminase small subunit [Salmonella enterica]EAO5178916.1 terminase small subunit [Salmonella enterica]
MAENIKGREVNRSGLAEVFGVSLPTVDNWRRAGCPTLAIGGSGKSYSFDTAAIADWLRERAVRSATGETAQTEDELKLRKLEAETVMAELELAKARGEVAPVDQMGRMVAHAFSEVRAGMRNIPGRVVSLLIGENDQRRFKRVLLEEIDQVLTALANADLLDGYSEGGNDDEGDPV